MKNSQAFFERKNLQNFYRFFLSKNIISEIDIEVPKSSSSSITDDSGTDCWTHYIPQILTLKGG